MEFKCMNTFRIWNIYDLIDCLNIAKISLDNFWGLWFFDWAVHYIIMFYFSLMSTRKTFKEFESLDFFKDLGVEIDNAFHAITSLLSIVLY